jgi:hypothetical protein
MTRRALVLAACLALLATFAAPAAAHVPNPDPAPGQKRSPAPDPSPQSTQTTLQTVTHAASKSQAPVQPTLPTSTVTSAPKQSVATPSRHHAAARATRTPPPAARKAAPPPPELSARAARVLRALAFDRLLGDVRTVHLPSASSVHDEGLLILGAAILLLVVLGEVGFLAASVRVLRRAT